MLADLASASGLVLTHGNGPQVGRHLLRSDLSAEVPPTPWTWRSLRPRARSASSSKARCASTGGPTSTGGRLITQVTVDRDDRARGPQGRGALPDRSRGARRATRAGRCAPTPTAAAPGGRLPEPLEIIELLHAQMVGGRAGHRSGGLVLRTHAGLVGVEVIDKDRATALLAASLGALA